MAANTTDIFQFKSPDMINLHKAFKRMPKQMTRATGNVLNNIAFQSRKIAVSNIESGTTTRSKKFVSQSMRVTKSPTNKPLNTLVASMGSIDISGKGRSDGFEALETGKKDKRKYIQTLKARGNKESRKVAPRVRMNKSGTFLKRQQFRGSLATMLHQVRRKSIGKLIEVDRKSISRGVKRGSKLGRFKPGIYLLTGKSKITRVQKFDNTALRPKRIKWMYHAIREVTSDANLKKQYKKEIDWIFRKR